MAGKASKYSTVVTSNAHSAPTPVVAYGVPLGYTPVASVPPVTPTLVCPKCGKPTPKSGGIGHRCLQVQAAAGKTYYVYGQPPVGYISLQNCWQLQKAHHAKSPVAGFTKSKLVQAIGTDRGILPPAHAICTVYFAGQRFVHPWLATVLGMQAIASGNYSKAPAK